MYLGKNQTYSKVVSKAILDAFFFPSEKFKSLETSHINNDTEKYSKISFFAHLFALGSVGLYFEQLCCGESGVPVAL